MKVNQLQAFLAVVNYGGFRAAGRAIYLSQPAVTRSIATLEEELHCKLFRRNASGRCELTEEGRAFEPFARSMINDMKKASEALTQLHGGDYGVVRVAISPFIPGSVLSHTLRLFRAKYRNVELAIRDGLYSSVKKAFRQSELDFALTLVTDNISWPNESFRVKRLFSVRQGAVAHKNHPIHKSGNPLDISRYEHIIVSDSFEGARDRMRFTLVAKGIAWPINITIMDQLIHDKLLYEPDSMVIAYAPYAIFATLGAGDIRPVSFEGSSSAHIIDIPPLICVLMERANVPLTPAAQYFQDCLFFALNSWRKDCKDISAF